MGVFSICSVVVLLKKLKRIEYKLSVLIDNGTSQHYGNEISPSDYLDLVNFCEETFNTDFEIERQNLVIARKKILGAGEFGPIFRGVSKRRKEASDDKDENENEMEEVTVAVKTLKSDTPLSDFKETLIQINILCSLGGTHENITTFFGAVTANLRNGELVAVLEFCPNGDLLALLRKIKANLFKNLFTPSHKSVITNLLMAMESEVKPLHSETIEDEKYENEEIIRCNSNQVSTINLLKWSCQISSGMGYVSSKNIIHGDLAARNMLLTANNVVKISDFGLSRDLGPDSFYLLTPAKTHPWRWLALETLREMKVSVASDVWAFGVLLFEIFSFGKVPYSGRTWNRDFVKELANGRRVDSPQWGNEDIYQLMMDCIKNEPRERLSFEKITQKLEEIKMKICHAEDSDSATNSTQPELNLDN